ncbi:uncharacterized protein [Watersipora subatra]|uniref:uncharacterized protein n=1 Tax=Watersipora subatra TaxID=2589382 RepID=UPI00355BCC75
MDSKGPGNFSPDGDASIVSTNWRSWVEEFEAFSDSKGIFNLDGEGNVNMRAQRKALLLYHAGARVREIYGMLAATDRDNYNGFETNETFQRHVFRKMVQLENETVSQYCARLRKAGGNGCNYHNVNDQIRDQIVEYCISDVLRKHLMEEGNALTFERTLVLASTHESVESRFREMSSRPLLNRVSDNRPGTNRSSNGFRGSRTGLDREQNDEDSSDRPDAGNVSQNPDRFAFTLNSINKVGLHRAVVQVGGVDVKFILDSGADCNVIDKPTWETLKKGGIVVKKSERSGPKIYSYTSQKPLSVIGQFWAEVHCSGNGEMAKNTKFLVIDSVAEALLGIKTCTELGLISIFTNLVIEEGAAWKSKFPKLFSEGIGKVDGEITLFIDHTVVPVAQP